jgi:preprotein translocase subunit SecY
MWLGEQITERGIGNGISLIILRASWRASTRRSATTLAVPELRVRSVFHDHWLVPLHGRVVGRNQSSWSAASAHQVPVRERVVGRKMYGGQSSHLPLKINTSGVIPPIFASSILIFPGTIASFFPRQPHRATRRRAAPAGVVLLQPPVHRG